ncbi:MAG TPA: hypothetical protein VHB45_13030 [Alloacidobacterium sp.]|nr:hypothetical protein [Alloacidobacterium sp.]
MSELNPNHPVTRSMHDQWHKIAALLMRKMGKDHVVISPSEVVQAHAGFEGITIRFDDLIGIELKIVSEAEAERLARQEGGLSV